MARTTGPVRASQRGDEDGSDIITSVNIEGGIPGWTLASSSRTLWPVVNTNEGQAGFHWTDVSDEIDRKGEIVGPGDGGIDTKLLPRGVFRKQHGDQIGGRQPQGVLGDQFERSRTTRCVQHLPGDFGGGSQPGPLPLARLVVPRVVDDHGGGGASATTSPWSSAVNAPRWPSVRYKLPNTSSRMRIGTPGKVPIGGCRAGNPDDRGCRASSSSRTGRGSSISAPRWPLPRGRSRMAATVSGGMPTCRNSARPPCRSSTPSAA